MIKMEKTKLGVSVGLLAAGMYFLGMVSLLALVIVAGYVLLKEDNAWLKRSAVKATVVALVFALLATIAPLFANLLGIFSGFGVFMGWPLGLASLLNVVITLTQIIILGMLGFRALRQSEVRITKIDDMIDRHAA